MELLYLQFNPLFDKQNKKKGNPITILDIPRLEPKISWQKLLEIPPEAELTGFMHLRRYF